MKLIPQLGDESIVRSANGQTIVRRVSHVAYARSGNAHNPSVEYNYIVRDVNGKTIDVSPKLRDLKDYAR